MDFTFSAAYAPKATACALAEAREWTKLQIKLEAEVSGAWERDDLGNMPLHWACRDPDVPLQVIQQLLEVYDEATQIENHAGLVPLQLAMGNLLPQTHISLLVNGVSRADVGVEPAPRQSMSTEEMQRMLLGRGASFIAADGPGDDFEHHLPALVAQLNALRHAMKAQVKIYAHLRKHNWAASLESSPPIPAAASASSGVLDSRARYIVQWKQGDLGIRLLNSSIGCRIEKLSQGHGITSGIMNCRLGDVLVAVNGHSVEKQSVRSVMTTMQALKKPISLEFQPGESAAAGAADGDQRSDDEEASAWCTSQHEMHEQVLLLVQDTIARATSTDE
ncbi:Aste57867_10538 [Aphanomyces stellatus]|uniref:Aste57867_10538 protein n=1 Tax=Aphanomyces stellatus TaxID=120398 RepID=A0A485KQN1_9STRA|nr:hypothetical protein As57867_010498 [Aphanomyces stellatus]VFT87411.1 Aste57867_10538 [Aphanomyces stellatus]